jgi:hypothetical protein
MAGLVPAIHVLLYQRKKDVDARDKRGHDEWIVLRTVQRPHALTFAMSASDTSKLA